MRLFVFVQDFYLVARTSEDLTASRVTLTCFWKVVAQILVKITLPLSVWMKLKFWMAWILRKLHRKLIFLKVMAILLCNYKIISNISIWFSTIYVKNL